MQYMPRDSSRVLLGLPLSQPHSWFLFVDARCASWLLAHHRVRVRVVPTPKLYGILVDVSELSQVMVQRCCPVCTLVVRKFQARLLPTQLALPEFFTYFTYFI